MEFHSTNPNSPPAAPRLRVAQVVDTLDAGGAERVAVNLANVLPRDRFESYICTTRRTGPLAALVQPHVSRVDLNRRSRADIAAVVRFAHWLRTNRIAIVHAHGTALFVCALAVRLYSSPKLVWHDHFGRYLVEKRPVWPYLLALRKVSAALMVNQSLAEIAIQEFRVPAKRVFYIPNFVTEPSETGAAADLPGMKACRIVCVANLRPEKDHLTLIDAMKQVVESDPRASLLLVGSETDLAQVAKVKQRIQQDGLNDRVFLLGSRGDVWSILRACDIGVLSSSSEGMPLALLEYGLAGLPVVGTSVGQCGEVLDEGRAGILVPPSDPAALASAIVTLLRSRDLRERLGAAFKARVEREYGAQRILTKITEVYCRALSA
jgi:glycosyltransferase involved in cell wall biosynthesis